MGKPIGYQPNMSTNTLPILLWLIIIANFIGPALWRTACATWRRSPWMLAALLATIYVGYGIANKGGTNTIIRTIRLYYEEKGGRYFPLDARIKQIYEQYNEMD